MSSKKPNNSRLYNISGKSTEEVVDKFRRLLPHLDFKCKGSGNFSTTKGKGYKEHGF